MYIVLNVNHVFSHGCIEISLCKRDQTNNNKYKLNELLKR